jgi:glutamate racemase
MRGIPVFGTIEPAVIQAVNRTVTKRVLVLGTRATVKSGAFARALSAHDIDVVQQPCPLFVPLVEEGITSGSIVNSAIELYLAPYRESEIDTVILGCTHYPLLREPLQNFFGPRVSLIDCASTLALAVKEAAKFSDLKGSGCDEFFVTDDTGSFSGLAAQILGERSVTVETVAL